MKCKFFNSKFKSKTALLGAILAPSVCVYSIGAQNPAPITPAPPVS